MKGIILFLLTCVCVSAAALNKAPAELEEIALGHWLTLVAQTKKQNPNSQEFVFVSTDAVTEKRLHNIYPYKWFVYATEVYTTTEGYHELKNNRQRRGMSVDISSFEATADGWRGILTCHGGPLGASSMRYYFVQRDKKWVLKEAVFDPDLPIS